MHHPALRRHAPTDASAWLVAGRHRAGGHCLSMFFNYATLQFVVVELKLEDYKPEFVVPGTHEPTVGIILVPGHNDIIIEMSLPGHKPIAVATDTLDRIPAARAVRDLARPALPPGTHGPLPV
jgi:hypothetical protein